MTGGKEKFECSSMIMTAVGMVIEACVGIVEVSAAVICLTIISSIATIHTATGSSSHIQPPLAIQRNIQNFLQLDQQPSLEGQRGFIIR